MTAAELNELRTAFADLLNYDTDDPTEPIDPLTYRNPDGDTCLHIAAQRGDYRSTELLLAAGIDPNDQGDMGETALHYAIRSKHLDVADLLRSSGASSSIKDEFGKTAAEL